MEPDDDWLRTTHFGLSALKRFVVSFRVQRSFAESTLQDIPSQSTRPSTPNRTTDAANCRSVTVRCNQPG
jgi:hypothetical protein